MSLRYKIQSAFLKFFSHIKVNKYPFWLSYEPVTFKLKGNVYYELKKIIKPGDIVLRGYNHYIDGFFIPGKYSHAAIYTGDKDYNKEIIHAMTPNVQYTNLIDFTRTDRIAVIRTKLNALEITEVLSRATKQLNKPYDYDFLFEEGALNEISSEDRKFSCSELIYYIFYPFKDKTGWSLNKTVLNTNIFAPDDIININSNGPDGPGTSIIAEF